MKVNLKKQYNKSVVDKKDIAYPAEYVIRIFKGDYPKLKLSKNKFSNKKICDISCGDGRNLSFLHKCGFDVFGTEITKTIVNRTIENAHGCKRPDECVIDDVNKVIFILEKKFQQTSGSVCEKIQTAGMKRWQYSRIFPDYNIVYIYCLSDWFKDNCKAELEYLAYLKVPVFWSNSITYKSDIVQFIINYKQ